VIGIFVIVAIIYFFNSYQNKYQSFQGVLFNTILITLILFLLFGVGYVYKKTSPNFTDFEGFIGFFKSYVVWLKSFFGNLGNVAGYTVKQNWALNSTGG